MDSFVFWTIATDEKSMNDALDIKKKLSSYGYNDFYIITNIDMGENYILYNKSLNVDNVLYKLYYLNFIKNKLDYEYYIFIDNKSKINYKPDIEKYLKHSFFSILDFKLNNEDNEHFEWNGYPIISIYDLMKDRGILLDDIYTANSNIFICRKSLVEQVISISSNFNSYLVKNGFIVNESIIFAYLVQLFIINNSKFLSENNKEFYGNGNGEKILFFNPLTNKTEYEYNPAITVMDENYEPNNYK